jgi:hypothetical protein
MKDAGSSTGEDRQAERTQDYIKEKGSQAARRPQQATHG